MFSDNATKLSKNNMKKFILGLVVGVILTLGLNFFGIVDLSQIGSLGDEDNSASVVAPQDLVGNAEKFGSLKVIVSSGGASVGGVEVDVGEQPGGKWQLA